MLIDPKTELLDNAYTMAIVDAIPPTSVYDARRILLALTKEMIAKDERERDRIYAQYQYFQMMKD